MGRLRPERRKADRRDLSPHQRELEERLSRFFAKALAAFAVLGTTCAVALLGFGIVLQKQSDLTTRLKEITESIQQQRYDSLVASCDDTNSRNIDVNNKIDDAIAQLPPAQRVPAEKQSKPFRLIISAAVPMTLDCYAFANARVQGAHP